MPFLYQLLVFNFDPFLLKFHSNLSHFNSFFMQFKCNFHTSLMLRRGIFILFFFLNLNFCVNFSMDFCPNFCTDFCNEFLYGLLYKSLYGFLSKFLYGFFVRISIQIFVRISVPIFIPICHLKLSHFCCFMPDAFKSVGTHWVQPLPHLPPLSPPPRQLYRAYTAFPDFFRNSTVEWWSTELQEVYENPRNASLSLKYDGIWIVSCPSLPFFGVPFCCVVVDCGCVWDIVCSWLITLVRGGGLCGFVALNGINTDWVECGSGEIEITKTVRKDL